MLPETDEYSRVKISSIILIPLVKHPSLGIMVFLFVSPNMYSQLPSSFFNPNIFVNLQLYILEFFSHIHDYYPQ